MAKKLLVHKKDTTESVAVIGTVIMNGDAVEILGESGEKVNLTEIISRFEGEDVAFALKLQEKEEIEVLD